MCSLGNCVDPQCVGVSCSNSTDVCSMGTCVDRCTVTCAMMDIKCFNDRVWALGNQGGVVQLQKLFLTNLAADGTPISFPGVSPLNGGLDDALVWPVTDTHFYVSSGAGSIYELYNGRQERIGAVTGEPVTATPQGLVTHGGGVVRRYEKRMMNGTVPPLDTLCNWQ